MTVELTSTHTTHVYYEKLQLAITSCTLYIDSEAQFF